MKIHAFPLSAQELPAFLYGMKARSLHSIMFQIKPATKKFINYLAGPILFCWMVYAIAEQIREQPNLANAKVMIGDAYPSRYLADGDGTHVAQLGY
jgi:hypothetical protein